MKKRKSTKPTSTSLSSLFKKKGKVRDIRKLTNTDDLGIIFSQEKGGHKAKDFASFFAKTLRPDSLQAALNEKTDQHVAKSPSITSLKKWPSPQDELDLHGYTASEAENKTDFFISHCQNNRLKTIRIITGKGLHSPQGPVLQGVVEAKLMELRAQKKIIAYRWEKNDKQKSGALIVYLK